MSGKEQEGKANEEKTLSSQVLEYYRNYSQSKQLPKYFCGSDLNIPEGVDRDLSGGNGIEQTKHSPVGVETEETNLNASAEALQPPVTIEEFPDSSRGASPTGRPVSPTSSITSNKKLEWDSGADIGYENCNKKLLQKSNSLPVLTSYRSNFEPAFSRLTPEGHLASSGSKFKLSDEAADSSDQSDSENTKPKLAPSSSDTSTTGPPVLTGHFVTTSSSSSFVPVNKVNPYSTDSSENFKFVPSSKEILKELKQKVGLPVAASTPLSQEHTDKKSYVTTQFVKKYDRKMRELPSTRQYVSSSSDTENNIKGAKINVNTDADTDKPITISSRNQSSSLENLSNFDFQGSLKKWKSQIDIPTVREVELKKKSIKLTVTTPITVECVNYFKSCDKLVQTSLRRNVSASVQTDYVSRDNVNVSENVKRENETANSKQSIVYVTYTDSERERSGSSPNSNSNSNVIASSCNSFEFRKGSEGELGIKNDAEDVQKGSSSDSLMVDTLARIISSKQSEDLMMDIDRSLVLLQKLIKSKKYDKVTKQYYVRKIVQKIINSHYVDDSTSLESSGRTSKSTSGRSGEFLSRSEEVLSGSIEGDASKNDLLKSESFKSESSKIESLKSESSKNKTSKSESSKKEFSKSDPCKNDVIMPKGTRGLSEEEKNIGDYNVQRREETTRKDKNTLPKEEEISPKMNVAISKSSSLNTELTSNKSSERMKSSSSESEKPIEEKRLHRNLPWTPVITSKTKEDNYNNDYVKKDKYPKLALKSGRLKTQTITEEFIPGNISIGKKNRYRFTLTDFEEPRTSNLNSLRTTLTSEKFAISSDGTSGKNSKGSSTENNNDRDSLGSARSWREQKTLSERLLEEAGSGGDHILNFAKKERESQLNWIKDEINHLSKLKKLLEKNGNRKSDSLRAFLSKPQISDLKGRVQKSTAVYVITTEKTEGATTVECGKCGGKRTDQVCFQMQNELDGDEWRFKESFSKPSGSCPGKNVTGNIEVNVRKPDTFFNLETRQEDVEGNDANGETSRDLNGDQGNRSEIDRQSARGDRLVANNPHVVDGRYLTEYQNTKADRYAKGNRYFLKRGEYATNDQYLGNDGYDENVQCATSDRYDRGTAKSYTNDGKDATYKTCYCKENLTAKTTVEEIVAKDKGNLDDDLNPRLLQARTYHTGGENRTCIKRYVFEVPIIPSSACACPVSNKDGNHVKPGTYLKFHHVSETDGVTASVEGKRSKRPATTGSIGVRQHEKLYDDHGRYLPLRERIERLSREYSGDDQEQSNSCILKSWQSDSCLSHSWRLNTSPTNSWQLDSWQSNSRQLNLELSNSYASISCHSNVPTCNSLKTNSYPLNFRQTYSCPLNNHRANSRLSTFKVENLDLLTDQWIAFRKGRFGISTKRSATHLKKPKSRLSSERLIALDLACTFFRGILTKDGKNTTVNVVENDMITDRVETYEPKENQTDLLVAIGNFEKQLKAIEKIIESSDRTGRLENQLDLNRGKLETKKDSKGEIKELEEKVGRNCLETLKKYEKEKEIVGEVGRFTKKREVIKTKGRDDHDKRTNDAEDVAKYPMKTKMNGAEVVKYSKYVVKKGKKERKTKEEISDLVTKKKYRGPMKKNVTMEKEIQSVKVKDLEKVFNLFVENYNDTLKGRFSCNGKERSMRAIIGKGDTVEQAKEENAMDIKKVINKVSNTTSEKCRRIETSNDPNSMKMKEESTANKKCIEIEENLKDQRVKNLTFIKEKNKVEERNKQREEKKRREQKLRGENKRRDQNVRIKDSTSKAREANNKEVNVRKRNSISTDRKQIADESENTTKKEQNKQQIGNHKVSPLSSEMQLIKMNKEKLMEERKVLEKIKRQLYALENSASDSDTTKNLRNYKPPVIYYYKRPEKKISGSYSCCSVTSSDSPASFSHLKDRAGIPSRKKVRTKSTNCLCVKKEERTKLSSAQMKNCNLLNVETKNLKRNGSETQFKKLKSRSSPSPKKIRSNLMSRTKTESDQIKTNLKQTETFSDQPKEKLSSSQVKKPSDQMKTPHLNQIKKQSEKFKTSSNKLQTNLTISNQEETPPDQLKLNLLENKHQSIRLGSKLTCEKSKFSKNKLQLSEKKLQLSTKKSQCNQRESQSPKLHLNTKKTQFSGEKFQLSHDNFQSSREKCHSNRKKPQPNQKKSQFSSEKSQLSPEKSQLNHKKSQLNHKKLQLSHKKSQLSRKKPPQSKQNRSQLSPHEKCKSNQKNSQTVRCNQKKSRSSRCCSPGPPSETYRTSLDTKVTELKLQLVRFQKHLSQLTAQSISQTAELKARTRTEQRGNLSNDRRDDFIKETFFDSGKLVKNQKVTKAKRFERISIGSEKSSVKSKEQLSQLKVDMTPSFGNYNNKKTIKGSINSGSLPIESGEKLNGLKRQLIESSRSNKSKIWPNKLARQLKELSGQRNEINHRTQSKKKLRENCVQFEANKSFCRTESRKPRHINKEKAENFFRCSKTQSNPSEHHKSDDFEAMSSGRRCKRTEKFKRTKQQQKKKVDDVSFDKLAKGKFFKLEDNGVKSANFDEGDLTQIPTNQNQIYADRYPISSGRNPYTIRDGERKTFIERKSSNDELERDRLIAAGRDSKKKNEPDDLSEYLEREIRESLREKKNSDGGHYEDSRPDRQPGSLERNANRIFDYSDGTDALKEVQDGNLFARPPEKISNHSSNNKPKTQDQGSITDSLKSNKGSLTDESASSSNRIFTQDKESSTEPQTVHRASLTDEIHKADKGSVTAQNKLNAASDTSGSLKKMSEDKIVQTSLRSSKDEKVKDSSSEVSTSTTTTTSSSESSSEVHLTCNCCKRREPVKNDNDTVKEVRTEYLCQPCNSNWQQNSWSNGAPYYRMPGHVCTCYTIIQTERIRQIKQTLDELTQLDDKKACTCENLSKSCNYCSYGRKKKKKGLAYLLTFEETPLKEHKKTKDHKKTRKLEEVRIKIPVPRVRGELGESDAEESDAKENDSTKENSKKEGKTKKKSKHEKKKKKKSKYTVQDYLCFNRPDFVQSAEERRKCLIDLAYMREERCNKYKQLLAMSNGDKIPEDFKVEKPKAPFTVKEMKEITARNYKKLPEVQKRLLDNRKRQINKANRLLADIFNKKLRENVLRGKMTLPTDANVISFS